MGGWGGGGGLVKRSRTIILHFTSHENLEEKKNAANKKQSKMKPSKASYGTN